MCTEQVLSCVRMDLVIDNYEEKGNAHASAKLWQAAEAGITDVLFVLFNEEFRGARNKSLYYFFPLFATQLKLALECRLSYNQGPSQLWT